MGTLVDKFEVQSFLPSLPLDPEEVERVNDSFNDLPLQLQTQQKMANRVSMGTWRKYLPHISKYIKQDTKVVLVNPNSALIQVLCRINTRTAPPTEEELALRNGIYTHSRPVDKTFRIMIKHPSKEKSECVRDEFLKEYDGFVNAKLRGFNAIMHFNLLQDK